MKLQLAGDETVRYPLPLPEAQFLPIDTQGLEIPLKRHPPVGQAFDGNRTGELRKGIILPGRQFSVGYEMCKALRTKILVLGRMAFLCQNIQIFNSLHFLLGGIDHTLYVLPIPWNLWRLPGPDILSVRFYRLSHKRNLNVIGEFSVFFTPYLLCVMTQMLLF